MNNKLCTICHKEFPDDEEMVKLRLSFDFGDHGRYGDELACQTCYNVLSSELAKTIHKVKHDMRKYCEE